MLNGFLSVISLVVIGVILVQLKDKIPSWFGKLASLRLRQPARAEQQEDSGDNVSLPDNPKFFVPFGVVGTIVIVLLGCWYLIPLIFGHSFAIRSLLLLACILIVSETLNFDRSKMKEKTLRMVKLASTISIISLLVYISKDYISEESFQGAGQKIGSFFTPAPPPEKKWDTISEITAPSKATWDKAPRIEIPWKYSNWRILGLLPDSDGHYEILIPGQDPYAFGGQENKDKKLPDLGDDLSFKIRSTEDHDLKIRVLAR